MLDLQIRFGVRCGFEKSPQMGIGGLPGCPGRIRFSSSGGDSRVGVEGAALHILETGSAASAIALSLALIATV